MCCKAMFSDELNDFRINDSCFFCFIPPEVFLVHISPIISDNEREFMVDCLLHVTCTSMSKLFS